MDNRERQGRVKAPVNRQPDHTLCRRRVETGIEIAEATVTPERDRDAHQNDCRQGRRRIDEDVFQELHGSQR